MNFAAVAVLILVDAWSYGFVLEHVILRKGYNVGIFGFRIFDWLVDRSFGFWIWLMDAGISGEPVIYRIFQKMLEVGVVVWVYFNYGWFAAGGILWAFYWELNEYGYYVILGQVKQVVKGYEEFPGKLNWLIRFYQSGYWIFRREFTEKKFRYSAIVGLVGLIISNLI